MNLDPFIKINVFIYFLYVHNNLILALIFLYNMIFLFPYSFTVMYLGLILNIKN